MKKSPPPVLAAGFALSIVASLVLLGGSPPSEGAAGDPDSGFGAGGQVSTVVTATNARLAQIQEQPDTSILVASLFETFSFTDSHRVIRFTRLLSDGVRDLGFGVVGNAEVQLGQSEQLLGTVRIENGAIVLVTSAYTRELYLRRILASGTFDQSFGQSGVLTVSTPTSFEPTVFINRILPSGGARVVLSARIFPDPPIGSPGEPALVTIDLDPAGIPDTTGGGSLNVIRFPKGSRFDPRAAAFQTDGAIVAVGSVPYSSSDFDAAIVRAGPDGTVDAGFGANGIVQYDIDRGLDSGQAVALQPDGSIVVALSSGALGTRQLAYTLLQRFTPRGDVDPSFGSGGRVTLTSAIRMDYGSPPWRLWRRSTGAILLAGSATRWDCGNSAYQDLILQQVSADGRPDAGFGDGGRLILSTKAYPASVPVAVDRDERIVYGYATVQRFVGDRRTQFLLAVQRVSATGPLPKTPVGPTRILLPAVVTCQYASLGGL